MEHNARTLISLARGGPRFSHLAFADDVLPFAEASVDQIMLLKSILDLFCRCLGEKVSEDKTHIFFSKNVTKQLRMQNCRESGFKETSDLGKYLGVPILHS